MVSLLSDRGASGFASESVPFLADTEKEQADADEQLTAWRAGCRLCNAYRNRPHSWHTWSFGVLALLIYTGIVVSITISGTRRVGSSKTPWSPAEAAIEWENRRIEAFLDQSSFAGKPSPEIDAAWNELMRGINIKILPEEMDRIGMPSLEMRDGSGYLVPLSVYHELHCIKVLRHWFYKDHYFADLTGSELTRKHSHAEHCLEELREATACHGDVSVVPYYWLHNQSYPHALLGPTIADHKPLHRCVKWDKLHSWAVSRRVDLRDENLLVPESLETI